MRTGNGTPSHGHAPHVGPKTKRTTAVKTIDELTEDAKFADTMVDYWAATRDYHDAEKMKAHLAYIEALDTRTKAHNALIAYTGASS